MWHLYEQFAASLYYLAEKRFQKRLSCERLKDLPWLTQVKSNLHVWNVLSGRRVFWTSTISCLFPYSTEMQLLYLQLKQFIVL